MATIYSTVDLYKPNKLKIESRKAGYGNTGIDTPNIMSINN